MSSTSATSSLKTLQGTIVLAGAGKMGGAMLSGWLAGGLDPTRVVVLQPTPSDDIRALVAKRYSPQSTGQGCGGAATLVVALKPQMFGEAGPMLKPLAGPATLVVSIGGHTDCVDRRGLLRHGGSRHAQHTGGDRPPVCWAWREPPCRQQTSAIDAIGVPAMIDTTSVAGPASGFSIAAGLAKHLRLQRDHQRRGAAGIPGRWIEANTFGDQRADVVGGRAARSRRRASGRAHRASQPDSIAPPIFPAPARTMVPCESCSELVGGSRRHSKSLDRPA